MAEYEARILLGTAWERTEVTIETHDRRLIAILEDAVREAFKTGQFDGGVGPRPDEPSSERRSGIEQNEP